jgi:hypothetical protein
MENYEIKNTDSPEKRAQIKICVIIAFIQTIIALVTESYANLFLLIAVMSFAYLVANTDDFFLVWDSAWAIIKNRGKNFNSKSFNREIPDYPNRNFGRYEPRKEPEPIEEPEKPKQTEQTEKEIPQTTFENPVVRTSEIPIKKEDNDNNSVIWANNYNQSGNARDNPKPNI